MLTISHCLIILLYIIVYYVRRNSHLTGFDSQIYMMKMLFFINILCLENVENVVQKLLYRNVYFMLFPSLNCKFLVLWCVRPFVILRKMQRLYRILHESRFAVRQSKMMLVLWVYNTSFSKEMVNIVNFHTFFWPFSCCNEIVNIVNFHTVFWPRR